MCNFKKTTLCLLALLATCVPLTLAAFTEISSVIMTQQGNSQLVDITYTLAGDPAIITLSITTNGVPLPDSLLRTLRGDVARVVQPGSNKLITWDAGADWTGQLTTNACARLTAWSPELPPLYMAVDLTGGSNATEYAVFYYNSEDALPYGGKTDVYYKSDALLLRRIPNGSFHFGEGVKPMIVTLTADFYAGVYPITWGQWFNVMGDTPDGTTTPAVLRAFRPAGSLTHNMIRGATNDVPAVNWPATTNLVSEGTFMHCLRSKTKIAGFDLPTEAQWEYTCRAGTFSYFNDGNFRATTSATNDILARLGRYRFSDDHPDDTGVPLAVHGSAIVGCYQPNAWGLYDMHGNIFEQCLDYYANEVWVGGIDPVGISEAESPARQRVCRGGGHNNTSGVCTSQFRHFNKGDVAEYHIGFRLFCNLPSNTFNFQTEEALK